MMPQLERAKKIAKLEEEMLEWVAGRRSSVNAIAGMSGTGDNAWEQMLISQVDVAEVQKLSAAIVALRAGVHW